MVPPRGWSRDGADRGLPELPRSGRTVLHRARPGADRAAGGGARPARRSGARRLLLLSGLRARSVARSAAREFALRRNSETRRGTDAECAARVRCSSRKPRAGGRRTELIEREERDGIVTLRLAHGKASAMDVEL